MTGTITPYESLRQADIPDLAAVLNAQRARATDVVADASLIKVALTDTGPAISLSGITEPVLSDDGVTDINGLYVPTTVADEGIAAKLDIPLPYLRKCRVQDPYLYRKNIEGWLKRDERRFLLRLFRGDDSRVGVLRAFLSDQYRVIDNLDVLLAVLKGITDAGVENPIVEADLTDRRMIVRVIVPQIALYAEQFLKDYRNPFTGEQSLRGWTPERLRQAAQNEGHDVQDKVVFAGFVFTNSGDEELDWCSDIRHGLDDEVHTLPPVKPPGHEKIVECSMPETGERCCLIQDLGVDSIELEEPVLHLFTNGEHAFDVRAQ